MSIAKKSVKWLVALFVIFALILTASLAVSNVTRASAEPEEAAEDTEIALSVIAKGAVTGEAYPDLLSSTSARTVTVEYYFDIPAAIEDDLNTEMKFDVYMTLPDNSTVKPTNIEVNTAVASAVTMDALTNSAEEGYLDDAETAATEFGITLKTGHTMSELRGFTKSGTTYTLGNYFFKATYTVPASTNGVYSFGFGATSEVPANEALESEDAIIYVPEVTNVTTDTVMDGIDDVTAVSTGIFYVRSYIDVPVAVSGLIFNAQQQTAIVDKDGYAYVIGDLVNDIYPIFYHDGWPTGFSLVPETYIGGVEAQQSSGTFALIDKDINVWRIPDGNYGYTYSTDNYTVNWEIAKRAITAPVSAGTVYTYNGQEQSFEFSEDPLTDADYITITGTPQTNVGEYTVTAALTYPASTYWAADTTDTADKEYDFIINPALITVPTPANVTYTFNKTEQSFQWADTPDALITITGTPQTAAGEYTITASIPANYAWNDEGHTTADKTFPFVIAKKSVAVPSLDASHFTYDGEEKSVALVQAVADDGYIAERSTGTTWFATNAGEYAVKVGLQYPASTYWGDDTTDTEDKTLNWDISKVQITKPTPLDNVQYVYDSYNKQFMLDVVSAETGYYTVSNNIRKNAGTQTVTVSLKDKTNTEWADGTTADLEFTFTVQRRPVNVSVSADAASHVYGNTPADVSISMTGAIDAFSCSYKVVCVDGEAPYAEYTPTEFDAGLNAGHYTLNPVYNDINGNYDVTVSEPFSYEVIKREIAIPTAISGLEYTGSAQVGVTKTDASYYDLYTGSDEETAVGYYSATYRLKSTTNCYWAGDTTDVANKTVAWSIAKKSITKPSISASFKIYNGTSQSYSGSGTGYTFTGSGTNAGSYPVTVTLTDKVNSVWAGTDSAEDYNEADKLVINKKTVKLTLTESADSSVYGDSIATITAGINPDYAPINTADIGTVSYTAQNFQTNVVYTKAQFETVGTAPVGNYILTATCSIDNPNYSIDAQTLPYEITKRQIQIPVLNQDDPTFTYTGSAQGISFFSGSLDGADYFTLSGTNSATNVGNYTYTATLNDATNCEWADETTAAKNYDWSITTRYITVPTVVDDTFDYDGNEHSIGFSNVDNTYVDITYDTQSAIGVYTNTTTVALKAAYAGNIAWDDANHTTAAKTYTLTIEVVEVNFTIVPIFNNTQKTGAAAAQNVLTALPAATTYRWFKFTGYTFDDDAVSNVSLDMEGETVYANYTYAVGAGDADGDGVISSADVILLKRWNVGLDRAKKIADAATAWAKTDDSSVTSAVLYSALDANNNGAIRSNDVVAVREALATGRTYKVIVAGGIIKVAKADRVTVNSYEDLLGNIHLGNPVALGSDIDAANEIFNEDSLIPVDIDLGAHRLTVKGFTLNTATAGATLKVTNGTLYTVTGITVTAPSGNVVVADVNGYSYDGTVVNLAAYSESLHIEDDVAFYIYKAQLPGTTTDYDDVDHFIAAVYPEEETVETIAALVETIAALADTRIGETADRMADIAEIKADTTKTEAQKAEDINALDVKKAILEVPIDTHVVVEESAKLSADKIVVKAQANEAATEEDVVKTFSIEVKNVEAEIVTVDISEVKDDTGAEVVYVVDEVAVSGNTAKVEVVAGDNTAAEVKKYVAQIGTTGYESLQAAINAAVNYDTIKLLASVEGGTGLKTADDNAQKTKVGKTFTIDFAGFTYTVDGAGVGSTNTETQAMHWGEKDNITLKNGSLVISVKGATVPNPANNKIIKMAMQNYANLTVRNMTMDFSNIVVRNYGTYTGKDAPYSGLEIPLFNLNAGSMTIENTTITMPNDSTKGVLIEIPDAATIKNSTINGYVSLGQLTSNVTIVDSTVSGVVSYFAGYSVITEGNVYSLIDGVAVTNAAELQAALNAGASKIQVMNDFTASEPIMVYSSVVIEGRGNTLTSTAGRTLRIASSTPANSVIEIKDYSLINTCLSASGNVRGVQFDSGVNNVTLILDNDRVEAIHYAINLVSGSNDTIIIRNGSYIKGWAAINSYLNNSTFNVQDSTLHGVNYTNDHTYAFNVITFDSNALGGEAHGSKGSNNVLNIERSTVYAETTYTNEYWVNTQYGAMNNVINVDADSQIIDANNDDIVAFFRLGAGWRSGNTILYSYYPNAVRMPLTAEQLAAVEANPNFMVKSVDDVYEITSAIRTVRNEAELNAALADGVKYIILNANFSITDTVSIDYDVIIDGNGHTITAPNGQGGGHYAIQINEEGAQQALDVTIANLTLVTSGYQVSVMALGDLYEGTTILDNVNITGDGECVYSNGHITVNAVDSTFTQNGQYVAGKDHVYYTALTVGYGGTLNAENCTVTSANNGAAQFPSGGTIELTNTNITATTEGRYALWARCEDYASYPEYCTDSIINVYGGTITGALYVTDKYPAGHAKDVYVGKINVYGGTFDHDPTAYVASGYMAVENEGTWTVVEAELTITTFAELKAAIAAVNAGTYNNPTLIIANDIQFEEELTISKSVYIKGDGEVKFIGYDASTKYDEAFYINVADEDQEIVIDGIVFDHFCYYSNVANKTKATASAVKNADSYITYGGNCPASTTLYITGCQFIGTARDMISVDSTIGCKGYIVIEDCVFDATDRLSSTLNMLSFYGNEDAELSVLISGCTFKEATEQNATWATSAIASFGNADITVTGCEFIACQIAIAIDNTFDRLFSAVTYPVYHNTTVTLVDNTYTNCYYGYYEESVFASVDEIPEGAELYTDEPFTYGDEAATQFSLAAEYDLVVSGTQGVDAKYLVVACYYVKAMTAVGGGEGAQGNPGLED